MPIRTMVAPARKQALHSADPQHISCAQAKHCCLCATQGQPHVEGCRHLPLERPFGLGQAALAVQQSAAAARPAARLLPPARATPFPARLAAGSRVALAVLVGGRTSWMYV